ncbi:unnamed protein product [Linum tenue]|uniref:Uncharacterized protein n=1 Tax=Linum tenue TaxID=586396 RepID=A0AAV0NDH6_9ROSI|nr:unnamed protein product [Linum tenue]
MQDLRLGCASTPTIGKTAVVGSTKWVKDKNPGSQRTLGFKLEANVLYASRVMGTFGYLALEYASSESSLTNSVQIKSQVLPMLGNSIYFEEEGNATGLYIIQYISSSFDWESGQFLLKKKVATCK